MDSTAQPQDSSGIMKKLTVAKDWIRDNVTDKIPGVGSQSEGIRNTIAVAVPLITIAGIATATTLGMKHKRKLRNIRKRKSIERLLSAGAGGFGFGKRKSRKSKKTRKTRKSRTSRKTRKSRTSKRRH